MTTSKTTKQTTSDEESTPVENDALFNKLLETYEESDSSKYTAKQKMYIDRINSSIADLSILIIDDLGPDRNNDSEVAVEDLEDILEHAGDLLTGYVLQRT